jgi:hypothetical protein
MPNRNHPPAPPVVPDLTDDERKALRELLERERRVTWLWSSARTWAVWIAAVVGGLTIGWDSVKKFIQIAGKG